MSAGNAAGGGGSPNQQAKDKAAKDAKKTASVEMGLGKDRMSNYSTAEGGTREVGGNGGNGGNNNTITQVTQTAPTVAEVDQVTTDTTPTETTETTEANRLLKIKKKGRSASIISGSQGVTKTSTDYSLGKKSLLGQV